ncbi:MAG: glucose 1-dehydrogenase [Spirochaetaceae bacterium]|nr:glucose 1-dehydrogenase [Myxococcales bacterium]MCB9724151.1 glucose 1-dehydrogenase [Spirochaetaceae bacterium]
MGLLSGKCIVITGAAQGMGAVHAERCVAEGASVVLTDLQAEAGRKLASRLGDAAVFAEQDVTSEADWDRVVALAKERFGRLDGLVNNAAIWWVTPLLDERVDRLRKMLEVNVIGSFLGVQKVAPAMRDSGGGSIVNLSSIAGTRGIPEHGAYGTSKWAVRGLSKVAAKELGAWNIRVNSVHPGAVEGTGMFLVPESDYETMFAEQPLRRPGSREEISGLVIFLLSDLSSYVTGHEHVIDGGRTVW